MVRLQVDATQQHVPVGELTTRQAGTFCDSGTRINSLLSVKSLEIAFTAMVHG